MRVRRTPYALRDVRPYLVQKSVCYPAENVLRGVYGSLLAMLGEGRLAVFQCGLRKTARRSGRLRAAFMPACGGGCRVAVSCHHFRGRLQ